MKRFSVLSVAALAALSVAGCASAPGPSGSSVSSAPLVSPARRLGGVPDFVNDAYLNASEDVLVGVGTCGIGGDWSKLDAGTAEAEKRARADLSGQLSTIMKNMVLDYMATSGIDPDIDYDAALSFELRGAQTIKMGISENGSIWAVMEFDKSAATAEVNRAFNTAAALQRMDAAFAKEAGGGPVPAGE